MNSNPEQTFDEAPDDFLRSLVDAMRRVVEATRDRTLAEMREAVETEAGQLDMARANRETALRERAEAEITSVSSWERAETERIRAEALRKVQAHGGQLDQELAELAASNAAEHAALAARADAYEREVAGFIQSLDGIQDPANFAAAARGMPSPWGAKAPPGLAAPRMAAAVAATEAQPAGPASEAATAQASTTEPTATEPTTAEPASPEPPVADVAPSAPPTAEPVPPAGEAAEPVAGLADSVSVGERNGVASATDASAADVVPAEPVAVEPVAVEPVAVEPVAVEPVADQATSIQVHGLGSFGAITSFKQSLERVDGIRSVTLGLGPGGEFVYTATHAPAFDLGRAIRAIEGEGVEIERDNGTLRVKVGRAGRAG